MSIRPDGQARCDRCDRVLDGDSIHAAAQLLDLTADGDVRRLQLCRSYPDGTGKIVKGCVNIALSLDQRVASRRGR